MKRLPALLFALALAVTLLPSPVRAEEETGCFCYYMKAEDGPYCASFPTLTTNVCSVTCAAYYNGTDTEGNGGTNDPELSGPTLTTDATQVAEANCELTREPVAGATTAADPAAPFISVTPRVEVPIPDLVFADAANEAGYISSNFLGTYITAVYRYLMYAGMFIAIVMIMVGGIQYVVGATAGSAGKAKERIMNAVSGFVLLLFVYVILFTVNPRTTLFPNLSILSIPEIPEENFFEPTSGDAMSCTTTGADLTGVNKFQDCMLSNYGTSESEARNKLVVVSYKGRDYSVHSLMSEDFLKVLAAIDASGVDYDITTDPSGGTFSWRCNKNNPRALSAHSWGTAIDVNPSTNPNCPRGCLDDNSSTSCSCVGGTSSVSCETMCASGSYDIPVEVIGAFVSNGFSWGGNYKTVKDYMHFTYTRACKGG